MKRYVALIALDLSIAASILSVGMAPIAFAATQSSTPTNTGQALEIAPPLITLSANPGQVLKTQIKLRDIAHGKLLVTNQIDDFVANGEDGTPKILTGNDTNNPYSMKQWIAPLPSFLISPQQIQTLNLTIKVPANASPGGHYGVIRFTGTAPEVQGSGVSLSASLGALVLLTVSGKLTHNLSVSSFTVSNDGKTGTLFESAPLNFTVLLKNSGNVQEQPTGHIVITDTFGKVIAGVNINVPPRNVLPGSSRKFTGALDSTVIGTRRLFGHYHAKLVLPYSSNDKTVSASLSFWVIPYRLMGAALVALVGGFFFMRWFIRRYNESIIRKAQGRSGSHHPTKKK